MPLIFSSKRSVCPIESSIKTQACKALAQKLQELKLNKTKFCSCFTVSQPVDKLRGLSQQLLQGPPPNQQHLINSEILPEIENKQVKGQILA